MVLNVNGGMICGSVIHDLFSARASKFQPRKKEMKRRCTIIDAGSMY